MLHSLKWNIICLCIELYLGWLLNENYYSIIAARNGNATYGCVQSINQLMELKTLQRPLQTHPMSFSARFYTLVSALDARRIRLYRTTVNQALYTVCADKEYSELKLIPHVLFLGMWCMEKNLTIVVKVHHVKEYSQTADLHQCPP